MARISNEDIAKAIFRSLEGKSGASFRDTLKNAVLVLARRRLLGQAPDILRRIEKLSDEKKGIVRAKVFSAKKLAGLKHSLSQRLKRRYRAKEIIFDEKVDPSLIGGFRVEVKDEVLDLSLKNKIRKFEEHLT